MSRKRQRKRTGRAQTPAQEPAQPPAQEPARSLDLEAAAREAIASPAYRSLPARTQAALRSRDPAEVKWALLQLSRAEAIHSAYLRELPKWAQAAILEEQKESMPKALVLLNEIHMSKTSRGAEPPASWESAVEGIDEAEPAVAEQDSSSGAVYEVVSPPGPVAEELAVETPEPPLGKINQPGQILSPDQVKAQLEEGKRIIEETENLPNLPALPKAPTPEQAMAWFNDILARRKFIPEPGVLYRIPSDLLIDGTKASGPSIIEGDAPVTFTIQEKGEDGFVVTYGPDGSKLYTDMPLVSNQLYEAATRALRHFPGYTYICATSKKPFFQPLFPVAHKLLKGEISGVEDVHFNQYSPAVRKAMKRQAAAAPAAKSPKRPNNKNKPLEALTVRLLTDPQIRASAARLRALCRVSPKPDARPPRSSSIPAKVIIDHAKAFLEGKSPHSQAPLSSLSITGRLVPPVSSSADLDNSIESQELRE